jgi:hypothetical protein
MNANEILQTILVVITVPVGFLAILQIYSWFRNHH